MSRRDFTILLNEITRILVHFYAEKGKVINFVVKLEVFIKGEWIEIERYDVYHNVVHKDIINKNREKKRIIKFKLIDLESGLNMAILDFKENFELYSWRYFNG